MANLTATHFYKYLTCPLWVWFDAHGDRKKKGQDSELNVMLKQRGLEHEQRIAQARGVAVVIDDDVDEQVATTLDAMGKGQEIYHGKLVSGNWVGEPDFLVPEPGTSKLGEWVYAPMDVKSSLDVKDEHRFQLVFYALMLEKIQGVLPERGYIITGTGDRVAVPIQPLLESFHATRQEIEKILDGEKPAPFLSSSCKQSPWFEACRDEAVACNDISLLYRLRRDEYAALRAAGLKTLTDLVSANRAEVSQSTRISLGRLERLQQHAVCYVENTHAIIEKPHLPSAKIDVYYDVESDTLAEPNVHYLHGLLVVEHPTGRRVKERVRYVPFVAKSPSEEQKTWFAFARTVANLPDGAAIYHYGMYEHQVIRELTERFGAPKAALQRLATMIDLQKVAARSALFPVHFYSLKDIAKYLGFRWRTKNATGGASVEWYHAWRKTKSATLRKKILEYNEDDVRATRVLKDFFSGL